MTMLAAVVPCSDCSDLPKSGRNSLKATEFLACSDCSDCSDLKGDGRAKNEGWSPAGWRSRRLAASAEKQAAAQIALYLAAMAGAADALAGSEIGPVLEIGDLDHDAAERTALAAFYAAPEAVAARATYCFHCGLPVPCGERAWSDARGWCCPTCRTDAGNAQ